MVDYFGTDVRRINHALKVYSFATMIARKESLDFLQLEIVELASILHDIGIPISEQKYQSCAGRYQELEGPPIARVILASLGVDSAVINRVCFIIGNHHSYTKIDDQDFQILVEADFLVNIFDDKMSEDSIQSVRSKYFTTKTGIKILEGMYL